MTEKFDFTNGVQFDPGFIQHMNAFVPSIDQIYSDLHRSSTFAQKKMKFKMHYHKLINLIDWYSGFYLGCMLWAASIKDQDKIILNNICYGAEYNEAETVGEVNFVREYIKQFEKDVKYYMGKNYKVDELHTTILDEYEEFIKLNKGFVAVQNTSDLTINANANKLSNADKELILETIAHVIETGEFKVLYPLNEKLFPTKATV